MANHEYKRGDIVLCTKTIDALNITSNKEYEVEGTGEYHIYIKDDTGCTRFIVFDDTGCGKYFTTKTELRVKKFNRLI